MIVTGAFPPDVCGVGDYTERLMAGASPSWRLFVERDWSLRAAPGIVRRLLGLRPSQVIVQYPTQGYGWSLVPHFLIVAGWITRRYRPVLVLHEYTSHSTKARLALALVSHFASRIVFTTEAERDRAREHRLFSSTVPTSVIGILSNIPWCEDPPKFHERAIDIAYFGHIRPRKGLEDFVTVMAAVRRADASVRIALIGEVPDGYEAFGEQIAQQCADIGCDVIRDLDDNAVGRVLADIRVLYLPFPDGVSARRGSVLAGLGNGTVVATRIGDATPPALRTAVIPCTGSMEDAAILLRILRFSAEQASAAQAAGRNYIATTLPRDWRHVAMLYEQALGAGS